MKKCWPEVETVERRQPNLVWIKAHIVLNDNEVWKKSNGETTTCVRSRVNEHDINSFAAGSYWTLPLLQQAKLNFRKRRRTPATVASVYSINCCKELNISQHQFNRHRSIPFHLLWWCIWWGLWCWLWVSGLRSGQRNRCHREGRTCIRFWWRFRIGFLDRDVTGRSAWVLGPYMQLQSWNHQKRSTKLMQPSIYAPKKYGDPQMGRILIVVIPTRFK